VWVESFEDIASLMMFSFGQLRAQRSPPDLTDSVHLSLSSSNIQVIFIHPLKTGLYRICLHGTTSTKLGLVNPLVDGMVTSRRSLGFLVTEMVSNCSHRWRLESDSAPPPHVRRKHLINDIILGYKSCCSEPAFYSALFHL
uniref:Uncharacterized protein n=1 Tax=Fundulus heteroclitus TaxID=8078 RepID=A0A3Q2QEE4_FUNHE